MSVREKTKIATSCITEGFLIGKVCQIGAQFFSKAQIKLADAVATNFSGALEPVYVTAEGVELAIAQQTAEVLCSSTAGGVSTGSGGYKKFTRGFIPPFDQIKRLQVLFDNKYKAPHPLDELLLTFNFEHFLYPDITEVVFEDGRKKIKLTGLHHDYLGFYEDKKLLKLKDFVSMGIAGSYEAKVSWNGSRFRKKTFFSKEWSQEKVVEKILESLSHNAIQYKQIDSDLWLFIGVTIEGLVIETLITSQGKVITAYPKIVK